MSKSKRWGYKHSDNEDFYCALFMSRNKDNKDVESFKPRRKSFLVNSFDGLYSPRVVQKFLDFRDEGVLNETSRFYVSFNLRDGIKTRKKLLIDLIENEDISLTHITPKIVSIAMQAGMNKTKRWMFDIDTLDEVMLHEFLKELESYGFLMTDEENFFSETENSELLYYMTQTPNGYAVLVNRGFDTREILKDREDWVTLKRDDLVLIDWDKK